MQPQSAQDYKQVLSEVIKKQIVILGPDITLSKARNVKGLTVSDDGTVTQVTGSPQEVTQALIDQFVQLSGLIVKKTMEPLLVGFQDDQNPIQAAVTVTPSVVTPVIPTTPVTPQPSITPPTPVVTPTVQPTPPVTPPASPVVPPPPATEPTPTPPVQEVPIAPTQAQPITPPPAPQAQAPVQVQTNGQVQPATNGSQTQLQPANNPLAA